MKTILHALLAVGLAVGLAGCDWDDDNDRDHVPPAGFGALLVDNNTSRDLRVYVDGVEKGKVGDYSDRPFDLEPGVYRVVLDQRNSDANWRDEVDIIEGRLTVLDVADGFGDELDVRVFFD
ncbi:MAG TPA: hypothetical protein PKE12_01765 [Kiritimatiellia bacterium]|nr:hypothetical protein [Kiritimatiellia bacterium]